jgi:REP element-mobilizing transposase RayT
MMRRFDCDTANWHVFARGARRLRLFRDDQDFTQFMTFLAYALRESGCILWAYALMTNHYHLVLRGSSKELTACMRRLNTMYSRYHNRRYNLDGHSFDGPYWAFRQATPLLMLHTIAYVLFNPVKGGLSTLPEEYPWSNCRCFLGAPGSPLPTDIDSLMGTLGVPLKVAWTKFHQAMEQQARRPARPSIRPTMIDLHQEQFEWLLSHAQENSERLRGEDPLLIAMHWAREVGVAPKAMAKVLGSSSTVSIRNRLYKLNERLKADPDLRAALSLE